VKAQNLILNPSFEEYTSCPDDRIQLERAKYWYNKGQTPDFLHLCGFYIMESFTFDYTQPPYDARGVTALGISFPFRLRSDTIFREYMMGTLTHPLPEGDYFMKVHVLAYPTNRTNHLGVFFSEDTIPSFKGYAKDIVAQVNFDGWIGQYPEWKEHTACVNNIEGSRYFTVGNFKKPGTDSVEFADINFSNFVHLDAFGLYKIPDYTHIEKKEQPGYCYLLEDKIEDISVFHVISNDTLSGRVCFSSKGSYEINSYVKGCEKLIRKLSISISDCPDDLICSNIMKKSALAEGFLCVSSNRANYEIQSFALYDRWGNLIFQDRNYNLEELKMVYIFSKLNTHPVMKKK
jgi:hypothetical protein